MQALHDLLPGGPALRPRDRHFAADVVEGLSKPRKSLPAKYFYDLEGSRLFEEITRAPEYYPTRAELSILRGEARAIAALSRPGLAVVEFGAGSSEKIRALLKALPGVETYVPIDVSREFVEAEAAQLAADRPDLEVIPVIGDFTTGPTLPAEIRSRPLLGFFPGSTIGNFEPAEAGRLLSVFADMLGAEARLLVGVDLVKDKAILDAAYDDAAGVTGAFNLNLLRRMNRELDADFDLDGFAHRAFFAPEASRVEMHLVSLRDQEVRVADRTFRFAEGETIHTENSYKYRPDDFAALASRSGWVRETMLTDPDRLFAMFVLRAA